MPNISSGLPDDARKVTAEALQGTLVDLIDLALTAKQAHWNVVGPRFRSVHLHLDEVVTAARNFSDTIAERLSAIGVNPDGRAATVARSSRLPQIQLGWVADADVVTSFVSAYQGVVARLRERIEATAAADPVSQDLLIGVSAELEKQAWMFQAEHA